MVLQVGHIEVLHRPATSIDAPDSNYAGLKPSTTILRKGHKKDEGCRAFLASTIFEKDVIINLRDGTRLRTDIFRPADTDKRVPALLAWSPYGKSGEGISHRHSLLLPY